MNSEMNRRTALKAIGGLIFASIIPLGCAGVRSLRIGSSAGIVTLDVLEFEQNTEDSNALILKVAEFKDPVILLRGENDQYYALSGLCTHLNCTLRPSKNFLRCPCHGSTFNLSGEVLRGPASKNLQTYPVEITEDTIVIRLNNTGKH
jgi:Rieske Fe-S protein